jgi:hypothetical protein
VPTLQVASVGTDSVTLRWNATTGATSYEVNLIGGSLVGGIAATTFTWGGLRGAAGEQVCFTVQAENYFFFSAPSNEVCATVRTATTPIWVRTATGNCGDQCGMPNCDCIGDLCDSSNPAGQGCSPAGDSCNVISGPSFIEYICE